MEQSFDITCQHHRQELKQIIGNWGVKKIQGAEASTSGEEILTSRLLHEWVCENATFPQD
jgi:hypothetical protein